MTERPDPLTNPRSDRVRMVKRLSGRSARLRHGQFLVEGPQGVREAVRHAAERVRDLYLTPEAAQRHPEILADARAGIRHVHLATAEVLAAMSPDSQGLLAVVHLGDPPPLPPAPRLVAVLPWSADPGNLGTVIRAADAAGAEAVVLGPGSVEVHNPKVVRATAGSLFHLPIVPVADLAATVAQLRAAGLQILAADAAGAVDLDTLAAPASPAPANPAPASPAPAHPTADSSIPPHSPVAADSSIPAGTPVPADSSIPAAAPDLRRPTAWLFGNEAHGLSEAQRDLADAVVRVPIYGLAESLNVATAATVCLYASARAQRA